jgi:hypothetical protein
MTPSLTKEVRVSLGPLLRPPTTALAYLQILLLDKIEHMC